MAVKSTGVTKQIYYRWRSEYRSLPVNQAKRPWDMDNARPRTAISDIMLNKQIFWDPREGKAFFTGWRGHDAARNQSQS
ncbi:hypothetical protein N9O95_03470 [Alphaproteobacteria bacterium]|nr:hypothetical protein [Alphaproteobacteria bacterium]